MESLKQYLRLGGKYFFAALFLSGLLYLLFVIRPWKKREIDKTDKLKWFLTLLYGCTLLLVTLAGRGTGLLPPFRAVWLHPFDALREALVSTDRHAWNQLALNVLAFVPLGLLLVWHARGKASGRRLFWLVLLVPAGIELLQFATGFGILDADDLITNVFGGAWGLCLGECFANRKAKKTALKWGVLSLLPVLLLVVGAGRWTERPYGFLPQDFADPALPRPAEVRGECLNGLPERKLPIYRVRQPGKAAAPEIADRLFGALGLERQRDLEDAYDDFTVYWALHSNAYVWVYYNGEFMLTIKSELLSDGPEDEALLELLQTAGYGLSAPDAVEKNRLIWNFSEAGGHIWDGEIAFRHRSGGMLSIEYALRTLDPEMESPALDEAAIRENLLHGRFSVAEGNVGEEIGCIECLSASIVYAPDSKGFYRPLYELDCLIDGNPARLLTSAC